MYVIGITGPSGAGKTTALRYLEGLGGAVYDCDAVYHALLRTDGELLGRIEAAFPGAVKDYVLDRRALAARVFQDPAGLERLTAITQPVVRRRVERSIEEARPKLAVIDAVGLFESGLSEDCDLTVAVVADEEIRVRRIMARDGLDEAAARADLVLENNGAEDAFLAACRGAFAFLGAEGAAQP